MEARRDPATVADSAATVEKLVANLALVVHAPADTLRLCVLGLLAEGHVIIEDFPGVGKTMLAKSLARSLDVDFSRIQFTPDLLPVGCDGRQRLRPAHERVRVPARSRVRECPPRRRDQPRLSEDAGRAARGDAGEPGHDRRRVVSARAPVHRARDPESDRVRGHVSAARGPARPLLDAPLARLSTARRRSADVERADDRAAARDADAGRRNRRDPGRDRRGTLALRRGEPEPLRRRSAPSHAVELPARARSEPAGWNRVATRSEGPGAGRRPGLRAPGRRQGDRAARCSRTG